MVNATQVDKMADLLPNSGLNWVGAVRGLRPERASPTLPWEKAALDLARSADVGDLLLRPG